MMMSERDGDEAYDTESNHAIALYYFHLFAIAFAELDTTGSNSVGTLIHREWHRGSSTMEMRLYVTKEQRGSRSFESV